MNLRIAILTLATLAVSMTGRAAVMNGGFETGDFSGWTLTGNVNLGYLEDVCANGSSVGGTTCTSHNGNYAAALGPDGSGAKLAQSLATTSGNTYDLTFYLRTENMGQAPENSINVFFGPNNVFSETNATQSDYTEVKIDNIVATSDTTTLNFEVENTPGGFFLDDVAVDPIPEPASLALVGVAMCAFGIVCWRRSSHIIRSWTTM